jgi:4-hydroxy-3-polyprenylbenzoate decarboxylase
MTPGSPKKLIAAITGASGSIFGIRILQMLQSAGIESHLVLSQWGMRTLIHETSFTIEQVKKLATVTYHERDLGAATSSGSFTADGMIVAPCSMRTLSAIAHSLGDNLIQRAAGLSSWFVNLP